ncbi:MAG TPA: PhzF family phenazine biosynthesis isomerase [Geminicoccaceae bacterium]|jgi:trans-2,3-dihydro-3-hydroxyanthranilate isomerase|nr:PhzF family phenazine biosynthesis isomerase [Geminicoccaceae bacterium]
MRYRYHTCDVFTARRFGGNPLAVLPEAAGLSGEQMQRIAREFNYSETTFVLPPDDPAHTRKVRIFTPGAEIPFAGHPNVGTAFVLAAIGAVPTPGAETEVVFEEGAGRLRSGSAAKTAGRSHASSRRHSPLPWARRRRSRRWPRASGWPRTSS